MITKTNCLFAATTFVLFASALKANAIDITPSSGVGPTPQQLAENIADTSGGVLVVASSAVTTINNPAQGNPNNPGQGNPSSDDRAMGTFVNGITAAGTPLPNTNGGPSETYAGGIDIDTGVCLCTGLVSDSLATAGPNLGFGMEGPNNGDGEGVIGNQPNLENHTGEVSTSLFASAFVDQDFEDLAFPLANPGGGDPTVLQFDVEIVQPGFLRISFVFGSDEYPYYVNPEFAFNDSVAIIVDGVNIATTIVNGVDSPFDLFEISACPELFVNNDTAPSPAILTQAYVDPVEGPLPNLHAIPSADNYNIELGGFTRKLTRETCHVLPPGTYTVKIVVQDVVDQRVDAAVFLEENSLKLYDFLAADFDLDGDVDGDDLSILLFNFNNSPPNPKFTDGDANGDGAIDGDDLDIVLANFNQTGGNKLFCADFNRDGTVDGDDFLIWQDNNGLAQCASRAEGDADDDGDVDANDLAIYNQEFGGTPSGLCGCNGTQQAVSGGGGSGSSQAAPSSGSPTAAATPSSQLPSADKDGDGDVDRDDVILWRDYFKSLE
ncbi:MAG: choice-of-anchor L domain-containing protein [Lacipirellulaceae bacterium]